MSCLIFVPVYSSVYFVNHLKTVYTLDFVSLSDNALSQKNTIGVVVAGSYLLKFFDFLSQDIFNFLINKVNVFLDILFQFEFLVFVEFFCFK